MSQNFFKKSKLEGHQSSAEESKYAASARAFRSNVTRDLANQELEATFVVPWII